MILVTECWDDTEMQPPRILERMVELEASGRRRDLASAGSCFARQAQSLRQTTSGYAVTQHQPPLLNEDKRSIVCVGTMCATSDWIDIYLGEGLPRLARLSSTVRYQF